MTATCVTHTHNAISATVVVLMIYVFCLYHWLWVQDVVGSACSAHSLLPVARSWAVAQSEAKSIWMDRVVHITRHVSVAPNGHDESKDATCFCLIIWSQFEEKNTKHFRASGHLSQMKNYLLVFNDRRYKLTDLSQPGCQIVQTSVITTWKWSISLADLWLYNCVLNSCASYMLPNLPKLFSVTSNLKHY